MKVDPELVEMVLLSRKADDLEAGVVDRCPRCRRTLRLGQTICTRHREDPAA